MHVESVFFPFPCSPLRDHLHRRSCSFFGALSCRSRLAATRLGALLAVPHHLMWIPDRTFAGLGETQWGVDSCFE